MKTLKYLTIFLTICLIFGLTYCGIAQAQVSEQTVDTATREVDHSLREKAEEQLTPPLEEPPSIEEEKEPGEGEGPKFLVKKDKHNRCRQCKA